jgi:pyridoxamine 5'-phosphate oxidase
MDPIADIRTDYRKQKLNEEDTAAAPMPQFRKWWEEAVASEIHEVNAMTLATVKQYRAAFCKDRSAQRPA